MKHRSTLNYVKYNADEMRSIPHTTGYYVDKKGNLYSSWVTGKNPYTDLNRMKKLTVIPPHRRCNYYMIDICFKNKRIRTGVHRLVCLTFNGEPSDSSYVCSHLDGDISHNTPDNLIWESQKDNLHRKILHGTDDSGVRNSRSKIDQNTLNKIRELLSKKELTHKQIGEKFGLSRGFITKIANGISYKRC